MNTILPVRHEFGANISHTSSEGQAAEISAFDITRQIRTPVGSLVGTCVMT
jgi:hypothetical protein